ncbi:hypothetical protein H257_14638 [Aphanomyces astaci]|uniref:Uncharacterized protein n=1 Tax=Aphanomyces astaci TaxID=112090 RepID=W4FT37_APHAT|nr:hypothetical protein H257_14638 [Aphanomyces astaci]ETV69818.1 hypothetical protein H257_14638 [Aphanomyces astaci]|eukprot:XP_009840832.1 hypothetical protein H257_14638 [Aphanomyces astaci]
MSRSFSFSVAEHWPRRSITSLPRVLNADLKTIRWLDIVRGFLTEQIVTACPTILQHSDV